MKHIILFCIIACCPRIAASQDTINPYNIQQPMTIILQNTDVYYKPFSPPGAMDTRANLCNESDQLRDSDAIGNTWRLYLPVVYDTSVVYGTSTHQFDTLMNWAPYGTPLGQFATWQRLFQAKRKADGTPSDIIAGGGSPGTRVTVSKNEDVDFRASGRIKLKSGFKVMPGAFFHAYTEPKWGDSVFADEFNDTARFRNQWHINNVWGDYYTQGADCPSDSNVRIVPDTDAHDGYALDVILRETLPDTCSCFCGGGKFPDSCESVINPDSILKFGFSTATLRSCPFPDSSRVVTSIASAYAHAPYGKYEIREKIPHTKHHTNNWGGGAGFEWDLNETDNANMGVIHPNFGHDFIYGPCIGHFGTDSGRVIFISSQPGLWCPSNNPAAIIINNVPYSVQCSPWHGMDTVFAVGPWESIVQPAWPSSLTSSTGPVTFYYAVSGNCVSDSLLWKVTQDDSGRWRIFSAAYHDSSGTLLHFSKWNQPTYVTLTTTHLPLVQKTFNCHWEYNLNHPTDYGLLLFDLVANDTDSVHTIASTDLHSNTEKYSFDRRVLYSPHSGYPVATLPFNGNDTTGGYEYHTFAMEWLPHEIRYLYDSIVLRRFPDRLVPVGSPYYDWISTMPRSLALIRPAQIDMDVNPNNFDPFGVDDTSFFWPHTADSVQYWNSITGEERQFFEEHNTETALGFEDVTIGGRTYHAAHHLIDYVKVWDVPKDVKIPDFPH
jgi:hypothetical protein